MIRATVLGAGIWGTAFAKVLADAGTDVTLWARRPDVVAEIQETGRNTEYLPASMLPPSIRATSDAAEAIDGSRRSSFSPCRRRRCAATSRCGRRCSAPTPRW